MWGQIMAIYSCNHKSVGRKTHRAGTASAHVRYIARSGANPVLLSSHIPANSNEASTWLYREEQKDRKNARVIDKIMVAIPRELNQAQRQKLINDYVAGITQNRIPWLVAIHQTGHDVHNPHAHIVLRDRDIKTGKRYMRLSDSRRDWRKTGRGQDTPTDWLRERWQHYANTALKHAGHKARIDRRTLEAQAGQPQPVNAMSILTP